MRSLFVPFAAALAIVASPLLRAWDYEGHRAVNLLAIESLPTDFPAFAKTPQAVERIAFLAGEPDRWRNISDLPLRHVNGIDHFIDFEEVTDAGISMNDISDLRYVFTVQLATGRAAHPDRFPPIDPEKNKEHSRELCGFLPWSITESYMKLKSEFSYLKAYVENGGTPEEIANAQANIIYVMGVMGHYVGDAAQPLHTTKNYNGWVGANPNGYTTAHTFHALIDSGFFIKTGGISPAALVTRVKPAGFLTNPMETHGRSPIFVTTLNYIIAQTAKVEPLYVLEKAGKLNPESPSSKEGRAFLENQILIGAQMLGSLWMTAWKEAPPDTYLISQLALRKAAAAPAKQ
ncbi:MAG: hypothetical protein QM790_12050 [Nibricoccus sp.]